MSAPYRWGMTTGSYISGTSGRRLRKPLLTAVASCAAILSASPALADCSPGSVGPRDFICTGAITPPDLSAARTVALVGATVSGRLLFAPTVGGNIGFSMDAKSSVTAPTSDTGFYGVSLQTSNGVIDTNTPSGSGINGAITAPAGTALMATTSGAGANINITTGAGGVLTGGRYGAGLNASTSVDGAINLNLGAKVSGYVGVAASAVDGAINMNLGGDVTGGPAAVIATTSGKGAIAITAAGTLTAGGPAVTATSGTGNISIKLNGDVSSTSAGVLAQSSGGDITVTSAGLMTGGVAASTTGAGAVTVTTAGKVTALSGDGVNASSQNGWSTVSIGAGGVAATGNGVIAQATGKGSVKVQIHGDVSGTSGYGAAASTGYQGSIQIDLDSGKFLSGSTAGASVQTVAGDATINNAGTIKGLNAGDGVVIDVNGGSATVNNSGKILSGVGGSAIEVLSGAALMKNTGTIDGRIVSTALTTVKNDGVWNNAAGSSISYLTNNGVLTMGPVGGAPGVLAVAGDATFGAKSTYNARIDASGSDTIAVAGTTTIKGGSVLISGKDADFTRGAKYALISSAGGVTGAFDSVSAGTSSYTGVLTYDADSVYMTALLRDFRSFARTTNQRAVANGVYYGSSVLSGGLGGQLLLALNQTADAATPGALGQLSGDGVVTGAANAALQAGHLFASVLEDQQALWRDSEPRDRIVTAPRPFQYAPVRVDGQRWPVSRQAYQAPVRRPDDGTRRWRVWASGFGGRSNLQGDQTAGSSAQSLTSYGGALGVDYQLGSKMLMGLAIGGSSNNFNAGAATGNSTGVHVGAYTGFRVSSFYGTASVSYASYANKAKRSVGPIGAFASEQENASFGSTEVRTRLELGRRVQMDQFAITPFTAVEIAHLHTRPFTETSSGVGVFALSYSAQGVASTPSFLGLKAEARLDLGGAILTPWVSLAWRHEWSTNRTQTATLVALPGASFVVIGARPARDAAQVKAGVNFALTQTLALFASFEGEFGAKNPVYAGKGGVKVAW